MNPPKWFWVVVAVCVLLGTVAYAWNVWHDNQPPQSKSYSEMSAMERERFRLRQQAQFR